MIRATIWRRVAVMGVVMVVLIGLLLGLLAWGVGAIWPHVDASFITVGSMFLGMILGSAGMVGLIEWGFKRQETRR